MTDTRCSKSIHNGLSMSSYRCGRAAKVERDGQYYCNLHDPVKRSERQAIRNEKHEAEYKKNHRINTAAPALLAACKMLVEFADDRIVDGKPNLTTSQINTVLDAARAAIKQTEE